MYQLIYDGNHKYYAHEYEQPTIQTALEGGQTFWQKYAEILSDGTVDTKERNAEYLDQVMPFAMRAA